MDPSNISCDSWVEKNKYAIVVVLIIIALIFIEFGHFYRDQVQNVLKQEIVHVPECSIDIWSVSHFLLFGIFGIVFPNHHLTFFTLGAMFELIEDFLASNESTMYYDCNKKNPSKIWCNGLIPDSYWYSNVSDVAVNLIGYTVGSAVRTTLIEKT